MCQSGIFYERADENALNSLFKSIIFLPLLKSYSNSSLILSESHSIIILNYNYNIYEFHHLIFIFYLTSKTPPVVLVTLHQL